MVGQSRVGYQVPKPIQTSVTVRIGYRKSVRKNPAESSEHETNIINMVIRNSGGGPARKIKWNLDVDEDNVRDLGIPIVDMSLFSVLNYMPANEEIQFYFGNAINIGKKPEMKPIKISVSYCNDKGKHRVSKEFPIDIEIWSGMWHVDFDPIYNLARYLKTIDENLENICKGMNIPLIRTQEENEYRKELDERRGVIKEKLRAEKEKASSESDN